MLERFRFPLKKSVLVFLDIGDEGRLSKVRESMSQAGGAFSTPRTVIFPARAGLEAEEVGDLVDALDEDDCITVMFEREGTAQSFFVTPPKTGGITASG